MIDRSWLTAAELEVLRDALSDTRDIVERVVRNAPDDRRRSYARWKLFVVEDLLAQLNAP